MLTLNFRALLRLGAAAALIAMSTSGLNVARTARAEGPNAIVGLAGCSSNSLPAEDDEPSAAAVLPFTLNFFGTNYSTIYVNNNGNVTFGDSLSAYTPFGLISSTQAIIAPYFADVDTRGSGSGVTTYGATTYGSSPAFCVNWVNVGYYDSQTDKLNSFQLLLVKATGAGTSPGDFDIYFNYDKVLWETGDSIESGGVGGLGGKSAHVGYSNGKGTTSGSFELTGSGAPGSFLNSNTSSGLVYRNRGTTQLGRYILSVRNGVPPAGGSISGTVYHGGVAPGNVVPGAMVWGCLTPSTCTGAVTTNAAGQYSLTALQDGTYAVTAFPPSSYNDHPITLYPITISGGISVTGQDVAFTANTPPPAGTTISPQSWHTPLTISEVDPPNGSVSYTMTGDPPAGLLASGTLIETPVGSGVYVGTTPPLNYHGHVHVHKTITSSSGGTSTIDFDFYLDPSGVVTTLSGIPISGTTVTLFRSDSGGGPFTQVPNGDVIMSPSNRNNPDTTNVSGLFGWDVVPGFYFVRAQKAGCSSPGNTSQAYSDSGISQIPPPVTDLHIVLYCDGPLIHLYLPEILR